jgi:hypothetical protein
MTAANLSKTERIDVRATALIKQLLQDAARASHKNVSEFLLDAGGSSPVCARRNAVAGVSGSAGSAGAKQDTPKELAA